MANVVLKDKNGNPVTHANIDHIKAKNDLGEEIVYTQMARLRAYYASYDETTQKYTIEGTWFYVKRNGYLICASIGDYKIIFTTKTLSTGSSYFPSELGGV